MKKALLTIAFILCFASCMEYPRISEQLNLPKVEDVRGEKFELLRRNLVSFGGVETFVIPQTSILDNMEVWIAPENGDYKDRSEFKKGLEFSTLEKREDKYILKTPIKEGTYQIYILTEKGEVKKESDFKINVDRRPSIFIEKRGLNTFDFELLSRDYKVAPDMYRVSIRDKQTDKYYTIGPDYSIVNDTIEVELMDEGKNISWTEVPAGIVKPRVKFLANVNMDLEINLQAKYDNFVNVEGKDLSWSNSSKGYFSLIEHPIYFTLATNQWDNEMQKMKLLFDWETKKADIAKYRYKLYLYDYVEDKWISNLDWTEIKESKVTILEDFGVGFELEVQALDSEGNWSDSVSKKIVLGY